MSVTAADYSWWGQWRPAWAEAHCVTLVSDITADGVVAALGGRPVTRVRGFDALYACVVEDWPGGYDPSQGIIGVAELAGGWAVIAEINGFVGVTERLTGPLSPGRTIVSHFGNINAASRFHWWRDGQLLVDCDLLFPDERDGADPDAVVNDLVGVGVTLGDPPDEATAMDLGATGFALAQRITGVACTPGLFDGSEFVVGTVEMPSGEEQQRYGDALFETWRHPATW
ncbi:MAG: hypothetical protein K0R68_1095 [Mycobacterium sp.]|jgi:hypothetical protein|nr:hypothetical protein [Mycobacterium sp.]